ncbi:MAG TPA: PHP domain-containing protein [Chloroflexi bacterium]|nr:PHP domain-containing protein [Chloroflexota bacterium]
MRTEFHCHTIYSKDSLNRPEALVEAARRKGIDRLIVTDHNTIAGALVCKALDPQRVVVGEEIMTTKGEILAAYVEEEIPPGLSPQETIARLRAQGAFISVSHPFDRMRNGHWALPDLLEILPLVDAIETFNARCMWPGFNAQAQRLARQHGIPGTVGSDAHALFELGRATLLLPPFQDGESLRAALREAIPGKLTLSMPWVHFTSRYAVWRKSRGLTDKPGDERRWR